MTVFSHPGSLLFASSQQCLFEDKPGDHNFCDSFVILQRTNSPTAIRFGPLQPVTVLPRVTVSRAQSSIFPKSFFVFEACFSSKVWSLDPCLVAVSDNSLL